MKRPTTNEIATRIYSDFPSNFLPHPLSGDLPIIENHNAVLQSMRNIIQTIPGERLYRRKLGSDLRLTLFENYNGIVADDIIEIVQRTIERYESERVNIITFNIDATDIDNNALNITLTFRVLNKEEPITAQFTVTRSS